MKFDFFEKLSSEEAQQFLERFRTVEAERMPALIRQCADQNLACDYSLESVAPLLRWLAQRLTVISSTADTQLPEWIRSTETYTKNLFEFDAPSKILILRAAYYLGESFVESAHGLHWSCGNRETALANMPVVVGFRGGLEMAPLLVVENLFGRVVSNSSKLPDIDRAVDYWVQRI
jgi:hypothetical protein